MSCTLPSKPESAAPASPGSAAAITGGDAQRALWLNGEAVKTAAPTLQALLDARGLDPAQRAFVCAVNGVFVPRSGWAGQALAADDRIDIIAPVVGG